MKLAGVIDKSLRKTYWHKEDTRETLNQKVYLVGNMIIPGFLISLVLLLIFILQKNQLFLIVSPLVGVMLITSALLYIIKKGVKWFLYLYYGGYIVLCGWLVMMLGGLPNSCGAWGGAFICFMLSFGLQNKTLFRVCASLYVLTLVVIVLAYPALTPIKDWTPAINNLFFTINEIWMCLFLVKSFYDNIVVKTEEAKIRAKHLMDTDLMKSKLYANVAHQFRTPLTLIRGNAEEISGYQQGEALGKAKAIVQNANKILYLVNQMLNLSKIEEGSVTMHYIQSDLVSFVRYVSESFKGLAETKKIRIHFHSEFPSLHMDLEPEKLEEIISNLISNAIKYTPDGGEVTMALKKTTNNNREEQVEISVRDTGIGIQEEELDKIFIRFYRIQNNLTPYREGTGIGLTLVKEYIQMMKGSIVVKSQPGNGSEFNITLPVTRQAAADDRIPDKVSFECPEREDVSTTVALSDHQDLPKLLIIEDNKELTDYLTYLLGDEYRIIKAENGQKGIELAVKQIPDIILSDVMMPVKNGFQVCRELKKDFRTNHIPIVLLTARSDQDSRITGLEQGADAYLVKPFNRKELKVCLKKLFVQRETLRLKYAESLMKEPLKNDPGMDDKFISRIHQHLEMNYKNDRYGIQHLCSDLRISRIQLHRKLTAITGQSASHFIKNFRLRKARKMLLETNKNVTDIAFEVGIADATYFSKAFASEYGITASQLRNAYR